MESNESRDELRLKSDYIPGTFNVWALGITIVIGGQYFAWNFGLAAGFGNMLVGILLMGSAYTTFVYCIMETTSALPFAGAFGLARCTLGFYAGFMVASMEALEYITYTATSALALSNMLLSLLDLDVTYIPLLCFLFYVVALVFHIRGGWVFWHFNTVLAVISFLVVVIFCLGSLRWVNFAKNSGVVDSSIPSEHAYFVGGMPAFMKMYPLTAWFFIGVESLGFCYNTVKDLHTDIPNGSIACMFTLYFFSIFILFVTCSLTPTGDVAIAMSPLDVGNSLIYNVDPSFALAFAIPATFATAFGFIFAYGKLICSLALSNLLPIELSHTTQRNSQPYAAMIVGSILGYFICLLAFYSPYIGLQLFNICVLSAFTCYVSQCVGYYLLRTKFLSLKRKFTSPLGIFGAFYAGSLYTLGIISVIAFQDDNQFAFIVFICLIALTSAYYYFVAPGQVFCAEEQKVMLTAYVINANSKRNKKSRRRTPVENAIHRAYTSFKGMIGRYDHSTINVESDSRHESHSSVVLGSESSNGEEIHVIQGGQQVVYKVAEVKSSLRIAPDAAGLDNADVVESKGLLPDNSGNFDTIASDQMITNDGEDTCPL